MLSSAIECIASNKPWDIVAGLRAKLEGLPESEQGRKVQALNSLDQLVTALGVRLYSGW